MTAGGPVSSRVREEIGVIYTANDGKEPFRCTCVHGHACMPTTTISLERSANELLKSRKRADEGVSEEVHRRLGEPSPNLQGSLETIS